MTTDVLEQPSLTPSQRKVLFRALLVVGGLLTFAAVDAIRVDCRTTNQYDKDDLGAFVVDDLGLPVRVVPGRERQCTLIATSFRLSLPTWPVD